MFELEITSVYDGLRDKSFAWQVTLKRGDKTMTGPYLLGLGHCKRTDRQPMRGPAEKLTVELARALGQSGRITISDLEDYLVPTPPVLAEYLQCLQSDARSGEHLLFEDFCSEFGHDTDSIKIKKIWRVCQETLGRLQKLLGGDFERFMSYDFEAAADSSQGK